MTSSGIEKTEQFNLAYHYIETTNHHLFITGNAGTGKSTLLEYCVKSIKKKFVVLAPTGVAALNVGGQTIHHFFNFYIDVTRDKVRQNYQIIRNKSLYRQLETIIIDEVSMLRADLLDCIDQFLQMHGPKPDTPFGGVQMVYIGDLYQLPPVVSKDERGLFSTYYKTPYFFSAYALSSLKLYLIELQKIYRQRDMHFITLLNKMRRNKLSVDDFKMLNSRLIQVEQNHHDGDWHINLTTTNSRADQINDYHLNQLTGTQYTSQAEMEGEFSKEYYPTSAQLQFKVGAQIMLLNNDPKKRWVNGSIAVIETMSRDGNGSEYLLARLSSSDRVVKLQKHRWELFKFALDDDKIVSKNIGAFLQYPFRVAWAITIHKSQGKTFDKVVIDLDRGSFASGQTYVAFSRCTSFEGIRLNVELKDSDIKTDRRIEDFLSYVAEVL